MKNNRGGEYGWTLRGKKYQLRKSELIAVIQSLFQELNIRFKDGQAVWMALTDIRKAKPVKGKKADFADALIVNKSNPEKPQAAGISDLDDS